MTRADLLQLFPNAKEDFLRANASDAVIVVALADTPKRKRIGAKQHQFFAPDDMPKPTPEFRFAAPRRWRFDFAWVEQKIALEVEGGVWTCGRHTRGSGFVADVEKYNAATALGWRLIRCTPATLNSTETIALIRTLLQRR